MYPKISVAPMMDWTDRHDRYFLRLLAPHVWLYTEMLTTGALIHGDYAHHLKFDEAEHPLALQLGGSDPAALAHCAKLGEDFGYDEINLNVGCPSDRVKSGAFGACLMLKPELVADCVLAMATAVKVPVTVKCRIGVDDQDSYAALHHFVSTVAAAGCGEFIVHARKAWLTGLSPKENREVPPLQYELVQKIKQDFPQLRIIVNGGLKTVAEIDQQIQTLDGAMIGREAYHNPYFLTELETRYFGMQAVPSRVGVIEALVPYIERQLRDEGKLTHITRHVLGLFKGQQGANGWRRYLSEHAHLDGAGVEVIMAALEHTGARMSLRCRLKYGLQVWQRSIVRLTRR